MSDLSQQGYIKKEEIGAGGFSRVYSAIHIKTNVKVAIKAIEKDTLPEDIYLRELRLMKMVDHPFCVAFYEDFEDENFWYMAMEYVPNGTLLSEINKMAGLAEWRCRHVFIQLCSVLQYLHEELKLVHRDLKNENIMFDANGNIRLIDFGLSNTMQDEMEMLKTACGSPAYAPPEMLTGQSYDTSVDIWSAGIVLYSMVVGRLPFRDNSNNLQNLAIKIVTTEPSLPSSLSPDLKDLLLRLLEKDPKDRITLPEIFAHPWCQLYPDISILNNRFGVLQGYRRPNDPVPEAKNTEPIIAGMMAERNLPIDVALDAWRKNEFTSNAVSFRILRREFVTNSIVGFQENAMSIRSCGVSTFSFDAPLLPAVRKIATFGAKPPSHVSSGNNFSVDDTPVTDAKSVKVSRQPSIKSPRILSGTNKKCIRPKARKLGSVI